jgi:hypothetical protein
MGVSLAGNKGGSVNTGGGGLVGGGGWVGCGIVVGGGGNVGVGDRTRVIGIVVNGAEVGRGATVTGTNVNGVTLAGPDGVLVVLPGNVAMLLGVLVASGVLTTTGRGVVPHSKNPRQ